MGYMVNLHLSTTSTQCTCVLVDSHAGDRVVARSRRGIGRVTSRWLTIPFIRGHTWMWRRRRPWTRSKNTRWVSLYCVRSCTICYGIAYCNDMQSIQRPNGRMSDPPALAFAGGGGMILQPSSPSQCPHYPQSALEVLDTSIALSLNRRQTHPG